MKRYYFFLQILIIIISVILGQQILLNSISNQIDKKDYAEVNNIKYGLLNVEEWNEQINTIIDNEINTLSLTKENEHEVRKKIKVLLNTLINEIENKIRKENSNSTGGWVKQSFINVFINFEDIKKGIPKYTDVIMREMKKTKTRNQIKTILNHQLEKYFKISFDPKDISNMDRILRESESINIKNASIRLNDIISKRNKMIVGESALLILISIILFSFSSFKTEDLTLSRYIYLFLSLIIVLIAGVATPMIDVEIKISKFSVMLMGHPVNFTNQILFFKSKSMLDIFTGMINHRDFEIKLLAVLILIFIIIFPLIKIISSAAYHFNYQDARKSRLIRFFIFKSGRWSMTEVITIAIFMTYVGFNRIISNYLSNISERSHELVIFNTGGTSLQPGYYLFLTYAILALFLSEYLSNKEHTSEYISFHSDKNL